MARSLHRWFSLVLVSCCVAASAPRVTVTPTEDADALLHNPDMGWVLYENYPVDARPGGSSTMVTMPGEAFDGVDNVAIMFAWSDVEREAGRYDFSAIDRAYDHWRQRGKGIQLRMSAESLLWWNNADPPGGRGVPQYLLDRLPAGAKQVRNSEGFEYAVVDAREPIYLERLTKFLAAVAAHFDQDRPVTLIDLRGFGLWGEWHRGFKYATEADRRAALCGVIDCWAKALPKHWLAISYSHDPDGPAEFFTGSTQAYDEAAILRYADFLRFSALDYAMTKPNVTLRRDGVGGAVYSNQRKVCEEAFATLAKGPMSCEFLGSYSDVKKGGIKWLSFMIDDALSLHPNYINVLGYQSGDALMFMREQPELFARGLLNMGYRLVPQKVTYPESATSGEPMKIEMTWLNRGVGRAVRDFHLEVRLTDGEGRSVSADAGAVSTSKWIKGRSYDVVVEPELPAARPGQHTLSISLFDAATKSRIALPLKDGADGWYPVGAFKIR